MKASKYRCKCGTLIRIRHDGKLMCYACDINYSKDQVTIVTHINDIVFSKEETNEYIHDMREQIFISILALRRIIRTNPLVAERVDEIDQWLNDIDVMVKRVIDPMTEREFNNYIHDVNTKIAYISITVELMKTEKQISNFIAAFLLIKKDRLVEMNNKLVRAKSKKPMSDSTNP
jgi:hypothetical protein